MIILIFIFGLIVGSFLNAAIHRLHSGESIVTDRSRCVHCHHVLSVGDLVPVLSFVYLRGRCRYCQRKISWQYPLIELFTAVVFALAYWQFGLSLAAAWAMLFIAFLIIVGVFDFLHYLILDVVVYPALVLAIIRNLILDVSTHQIIFSLNSFTVNGLIAAAVIAGFFSLQYLFSRGRWIGLGDVKLGLFLGALLGLKQGLIMLMLAYCLGALVGLILIAWGRKHLGSRLPFGSFLGASAIIMVLFGSPLSAWYLRLLGL